MEGFLKIRVTPKTYLDGFSWIFHHVSSHWGTPKAVQVPGSPSFSKEHEDFDLAWVEGVDEHLPGPNGPKTVPTVPGSCRCFLVPQMEVSQIPKLRLIMVNGG